MKIRELKIENLCLFSFNEVTALRAYINNVYNTIEEGNQDDTTLEVIETLVDLKRIELKIKNAYEFSRSVHEVAQITETDKKALELVFDVLDQDFKDNICDFNIDEYKELSNKIFKA